MSSVEAGFSRAQVFAFACRALARRYVPLGWRAVKEAMRRIIDRVLRWGGESLWKSMEKMFYSLHVSAMLKHKLIAPQGSPDVVRELVDDFLLSIRAH